MLARDSFGATTMVNKPPRPPCWRDFIPDEKSQQTKHKSSFSKSSALSKSVDFTDLRKLSKISHEEQLGKGGSKTLPSPSRSHTHPRKKSKSRLHRTSSQLNIEQSDLPEKEGLTLRLADTKPKEIGLRRHVVDARIYLDENTRRCAAWLAGVRACEPLEDIAFAQGTGVDVEVPDDCTRDLRPPHNSSASGSDAGADDPLPCLPGPSSTHSPHGARPKTVVRGACCAANSSDDSDAKVRPSSRSRCNKENRVSERQISVCENKIFSTSISQNTDDSYKYSPLYVDHTDIHLENT